MTTTAHPTHTAAHDALEAVIAEVDSMVGTQPDGSVVYRDAVNQLLSPLITALNALEMFPWPAAAASAAT